MTEHVIVDGRVFATEAADRGMGRYVSHLLESLVAAGHGVTVTLPAPSASRRWPAGVRAHVLPLEDDALCSTVRLNRFLAGCAATLYIDATPFIAPDRYDVHVCPVIAVLYDLIPMRFPNDYFQSFGPGPLDAYVNGLARVKKADHVIAISDYVKGHALRYLGVGRDRCTVIPPAVGAEYANFALAAASHRGATGGVACIQGAHRSKNFPRAIRFLERLSRAADSDVDIVVPTPTQRTLVEGARSADGDRIRIHDSLEEESKFALQKGARAIAHLSLDEGYGIPLAEALFLHRPVICIDNAINRELIAGCEDPAAAGILLLDDPTLGSDADMRAAAMFVRTAPRADLAASRRLVVDRLLARQSKAGLALASAIVAAKAGFDAWHAEAGLAVVAPTEIGSCGVSDYCHALARSESYRYVFLLGPAPRELQLKGQLRLLPLSLLQDARGRMRGALFNLAVSDSLARAFDAIAEASTRDDVLIVHDAGSYLPGLLMQANATGNRRALFDRYLRGEPEDVRALSTRWLDVAKGDAEQSAALFLQIDRSFRSNWLVAFQGSVVSHHAAFAQPSAGGGERILGLLPSESQILKRARYAPMPIDARASPAIVRLAGKMRWALGLARHDLLVCCAGSVVGGKYLDVVARVIARLDRQPGREGASGSVMLLLAGRVLDDSLFAALRADFAASGAHGRLVQIVEGDEARYDALLMASDVVVALREQRRIQMSHSYVRALALGRPIVTNEGAGFDDQDAAAVCRDDHLAEDLERHLLRLWSARSGRLSLAASSQSRYRERHTLDTFFARMKSLHDAAASV